MLFFVWLKFIDGQKQFGLTKFRYFFFTSLSGFPCLKIPEISSYGHIAATKWSFYLDVNKMAEYKSISTHILLAYLTLKNITTKSVFAPTSAVCFLA